MSPVLSTPSILRQLYKLLFKLHSALVLDCEKYNRDWTGVLKVHQAYGLQDTYSTKQNCLGESCLQKQVLSGLQKRFTCSGQRQWCDDIYTFYKSFSMSTGWANTTLTMVTLAAMNMLQWNRNFQSKTILSLSYTYCWVWGCVCVTWSLKFYVLGLWGMVKWSMRWKERLVWRQR